LTVTAISVGNFTNVASVISDENKTPTNASTDNVTINPDVKLNLTKVADTNMVKVGDNVIFTITVINNGKSDATGVVISDIIDDAFTRVDGGDYDSDSRTVTWNIKTIAANTSASVTLIVTASKAGNYSNVAFVNSNENKTPVNGSSDNVTVSLDVRLNLTKSANASEVKVGDNVTFTITVINDGKSDATNVVISDILADAFSYVSGADAFDESSRNATWTISSIVAGQSETVTLVVTASKSGNYSNVAFVSSLENKTPVNGSSDNVTVSPDVRLNLTKSSNLTEVKVGDRIEFTIVVTNNGKSDASNVVISDVLGKEFAYIEGGSFDKTSRNVTWNVGSIASGKSANVTLIVEALSEGSFANTAVTSADENKTDVPGSSDNVTVRPYVKLDIVKDSNATYVKVGEYINFTITVTNNGKSNATNVQIVDKLQDAFGYVNSSEYSEYVYGVVTWTIENITAGESVTVYVIVNATKEGTYTNNATVMSSENTTESNATKVIVVGNVIILNVTKVADVSSVKVGDEIVFTITITNLGTDKATNVNVYDVLGNEFAYVSSTGTYDNATRTVTWVISSIDARSSQNVTVTVKALTNGTFVNAAVANAKENETNVTGTSDNITVDPYVKLNVTKVLVNSTPIYVGDNVTYTIVVTNNGLSDATNVVVNDTVIGAGEVISCVDQDGKMYTGESWIIDSVAAGESVTLTVVVRLTASGSVANNVTVKSDENDTVVTNQTPDVEVLPDVRLNVTKELVTVGPIYAGDNVTYVIVVTNNGLSEATNVVVKDTVVGAGEIVSCVDLNGNEYYGVSWIIDSVAAGKNVTLTVTVHVLADGTIANNVTVKSDENDTPVTNGTPSADVLPDVKLDVTKVLVNSTPIYVGDNVTYVIVVTNNGLSDATNVVVNDTVVGAGEFISCVDQNGKVYDGVSWTVESIGAGESVTLTVVVRLTASGSVANNVTVKSDENDTVVTNQTPDAEVLPDVKLDVTKVLVNSTPIYTGDDVTYVIVVTNNGLSDATNVVVNDTVKGNGMIVSCVDQNGKVYDNDGRWTIESIASCESVTLTVVVRLTASGSVANNVTVKSDENDTVVTNQTPDADVLPDVKLNVTKVADISAVKVGDEIVFTIIISNSGLDDASDVVITDVLGEEFGHIESSDDGQYDDATRTVTWVIRSIASQSSENVTVTVKALTNGTFANTAVAYADENKTNVNGTSDNITVDPYVELRIVKVANVTEVVVGGLIEYTITVFNDGLSDATDVNVWDILPAGVKYVSGADAFDESSRNATWTIKRIASDSSEVVYLVVNATAPGDLANTAFANCSEDDTVVNKTSDNVTVNPNVELGIIKKANVTSAVVGDLIKFTIVVTNNGLSDASDVVISDYLVEAFEHVEGGDYDSDSRFVTLTIDKIEAGKSAEVFVIVKAVNNGTFYNGVVAYAKENDTIVNNVSDDIPIIPNVKLSIVKEANVTEAVVGDLIKYTISVYNNGLSDANDVNVWDILPGNVKYVSGADAYDENARKATWTIDKIEAGDAVEVILVVNVTSAGNLANTAFANSSENDTVVNKTSDNVTVNPNVELGIIKKANVTSAVVGDLIKFTIVVTNNGLSDASDVVVTDYIIEAFDYVEGGNYRSDLREVTWTIDKIEAGKSAEVFVIVKAVNNGTFYNGVVAYAKENDTIVNNVSDDIPVLPDVKLEIEKVANVTAAFVGDNIKFTITIKNSGLSDATNVEIEDVLPESLKFVSTNGTYVNDGQNVKWTLDKVEGNSSVSVYVVASAVSNGPAVNFANVTCSENSTDNTTTDEIEVKPVVDLTVVKTANVSAIYVGDKVSYNIVVTNNGPSNATNVIVVDELPNGLKFVSSNVECVVVDNRATWTVSKLAAGENLTIEVVCTAVGSGDLTNTVNVTCDENKTNTTGGTPIHVSDLVDVAIELSVDKTNPNINDEVIITLKVRNNGPSDATGIVGKLNRDFLNGLRIISIDSDEIKFATGLLGYSLSDVLKVNENGEFSIDLLNANQEVSATIKAAVIRDGNITVDGTVSSSEDDSDLTNNYDEITMVVHSLVDLSVTKTVSNAAPTVGDVIEYVITVVNAGPSNATGVVVNEKLPDGVVFISDDSSGAYNRNTGVWTVGSINANETRTLTIKVLTDKVGQITNNVDVVSNEDNTNKSGSKTNVTIDVQPVPKVDLEVIITSNTTKTDLGDLVEFTITVVNRGTADATGVTVKDLLPDGLQYTSDDGNGAYNPGNGIWTVGNLNSGDIKVLHIIAKTTKAGNITNTVLVDCSQEILDANSTVASVTVEVVEHEKPIENASEDAPAKQSKLDSKATGNPFVILAMALLFAGLGLRRRKE